MQLRDMEHLEERAEALNQIEDHFLTISRLIEYAANSLAWYIYVCSMPEPPPADLKSSNDELRERSKVRRMIHHGRDSARRIFIITLWEIDAIRKKTVTTIGSNDAIRHHWDQEKYKASHKIFTDTVCDDISHMRFWAAHGAEGFSDTAKPENRSKNPKGFDRATMPQKQDFEMEQGTIPAGSTTMYCFSTFDRIIRSYNGRMIEQRTDASTITGLNEWFAHLVDSLAYFRCDNQLAMIRAKEAAERSAGGSSPM